MIIMLLYANKYFVEKIEIRKNMLRDLTVSLMSVLHQGGFEYEIYILFTSSNKGNYFIKINKTDVISLFWFLNILNKYSTN